ncbi:hypothetical protein GCM10010214_00030 [Streptomyces abikoensis]|nr:hypothetical protein GCM10010214_00030 [Streptomyces abikoensis]
MLVTEGNFHDVDSCELGYTIAGQQAGRAVLVGAGLLPPEAAAVLRWATWPGDVAGHAEVRLCALATRPTRA